MANATVPFTNVIAEISKQTKVDPTDVGKGVRRHIRANTDDLAKKWPGLKNHEKGNRYPDLPQAFAQDFIAGRVASMSKAS